MPQFFFNWCNQSYIRSQFMFLFVPLLFDHNYISKELLYLLMRCRWCRTGHSWIGRPGRGCKARACRRDPDPAGPRSARAASCTRRSGRAAAGKRSEPRGPCWRPGWPCWSSALGSSDRWKSNHFVKVIRGENLLNVAHTENKESHLITPLFLRENAFELC